MKAKLVYHVKEYHSDGSIQEIKIWEEGSEEGSVHEFRNIILLMARTNRNFLNS